MIKYYICNICETIKLVQLERIHKMTLKAIIGEETVNICQECEAKYIIPKMECKGTNAEDIECKIYENTSINYINDLIYEIYE